MATEVQVTRGNVEGGAYHEKVIDELFEITPLSTPFSTSIGDGMAGSVYMHWARRSLTTRADNAQTEGDVYSMATDAANPTLASRVSNWTQIFRKLPMVTKTQAAMDPIGIRNLMTDQVNMRQSEMATDMEHAFLRGSVHSGPTNTSDTNARRLGGFANVMTYVTTYATTATFNESDFNGFHENGWIRGALLRDTLVHGRAKRWISNFTASSTKYVLAEEKMLVNAVDVYESDFYLTRIMLSHDVPPGPTGALTGGPVGNRAGVFLYDRDQFKKLWLRRPTRGPLPVPADAWFWEIIAEVTLEFGHPAAGTAVLGIRHGVV